MAAPFIWPATTAPPTVQIPYAALRNIMEESSYCAEKDTVSVSTELLRDLAKHSLLAGAFLPPDDTQLAEAWTMHTTLDSFVRDLSRALQFHEKMTFAQLRVTLAQLKPIVLALAKLKLE